jgi:hypothetical protein
MAKHSPAAYVPRRSTAVTFETPSLAGHSPRTGATRKLQLWADAMTCTGSPSVCEQNRSAQRLVFGL